MKGAGHALGGDRRARNLSARTAALNGDLERHLAHRGYDVRCHFAGRLADVERGSDPGRNLEILRRMGVTITEQADPVQLEAMARSVYGATLLVDALLGTGLAGPVREPYA